jgi:hypothetical protein
MAHGPDPRLEQFTSSAVDIYGAGSVCLSVPRRIIPFLLGGLDLLRYPDAWSGSAEEVNRTTGQIENFIIDLILKESCETPCPDCPTAQECAPCAGGGSACFTMEDYMPCLDISNMLKIVDGVLYAKNDCCEWVAVGGLTNLAPSIDPTVIDPLLPTGQNYSACGRAYAVWKTINDVADCIDDHYLDDPTSSVQNIRNCSPVNVSTAGVLLAMAQRLVVAVLPFDAHIDDASRRQRVLARLSAEFEASAGPLTDAEWSAVVKAYSSQWNLLSAGVFIFYQNVFQYVIGRDRLSEVAQIGALSPNQSCEDVEQIDLADVTQDWSGVDWTHWVDFTKEKPTQFEYVANGTVEWGYGVGLWDKAGANGYSKIATNFTYQHAGGAITHVYMLIWTPVGFDYAGPEHIKNNSGVLIAPESAYVFDTFPSQGGLITMFRTGFSSGVGSVGQKLFHTVEGTNADTEEKLLPDENARILAVGVGGTGTDPFDW